MIRFFKQIAHRKYNQDWIDSWNKVFFVFFFFFQLDFVLRDLKKSEVHSLWPS